MCTLFHHLVAFLARAIVTVAAVVTSVTLAIARCLHDAPWSVPATIVIFAALVVVKSNVCLIHYHHVVTVVFHVFIVLTTGGYYYRKHHHHHNHNLLHNLNFLKCYTFYFYFWCKDTAKYQHTKMIIPKLAGAFPKHKGDFSSRNNKKYLIVLA